MKKLRTDSDLAGSVMNRGGALLSAAIANVFPRTQNTMRGFPSLTRRPVGGSSQFYEA